MISGIIAGGRSYATAINDTIKFRLWAYFFAPTVISILLGIFILGGAWALNSEIGAWLIQYYPLEWGKNIIETIIGTFGSLFILVIGLILFKNLVLAFSSPFMSMLSSRVEQKHLGNHQEPPFQISKFIRDLIRGLTIALRNIIFELLLTTILFFVGLIPIFTPFTTVLILLIQAYYAGFGNMDFTLERYFNVRQSIQFVRRNRGLAIGNGAVFLFLFLSLIGFIFAIPLGTIAATNETLKRI